MTTSLLRSTLSIAVAGAATLLIVAGSAAPAGAATAPDAPPTVRISTSGIDLAHPAGVARLSREIATTARRLCSRGGNDLATVRAVTECTRNATAGAMTQLTQLAANARETRAMLAEAATPGTPVRR